jgi:thiamine pyrophosphate-dependent acetolactate synthase large subunit-like protein
MSPGPKLPPRRGGRGRPLPPRARRVGTRRSSRPGRGSRVEGGDPYGGDRIAAGLARHGVRFLFTLCGGHISPILVGAKRLGIRVVDVRDEAAAVFAADAVARLTGVPGVAAVTAGPGVTNTITAVKNAQLAQSPVVVLGGAAATLLKGRGALQDIDQMALIRPHVKWAASASAVRELQPLLDEAFREARAGVPGPVFLECPIDLLYDEALVRRMYGVPAKAPAAHAGATAGGTAAQAARPAAEAGGGGAEAAGGLRGAAMRWYLQRHLRRLFRPGPAGYDRPLPPPPAPEPPAAAPRELQRAAAELARSRRPVLVVGSQAVLDTGAVGELARAVAALGMPVYLAGGARGLLGPSHPLQLRHRRKEALREADLVLLAGIPADFRLDYGRQINRHARLVTVNRNAADLRRNRRPSLAVHADPGHFLRQLAQAGGGAGGRGGGGASGASVGGGVGADDRAGGSAADDGPAMLGGGRWASWLGALRARDAEREAEIAAQAAVEVGGGLVNPLHLCRAIEARLAQDSVIVADGGDFVGTASYILRPRAPLSWLDPGVFGTLGVGGGFALAAKLCRPEADVWLLYGDGSAAYSLAEFDTLARHGLPVIAVVGNDAGWTQIAREQVEMLHDDVGTVLARTDYHRVAAGYGAQGLCIARPEDVEPVLAEAVRIARAGAPVLVNAQIGRTEFRKGSISV